MQQVEVPTLAQMECQTGDREDRNFEEDLSAKGVIPNSPAKSGRERDLMSLLQRDRRVQDCMFCMQLI